MLGGMESGPATLGFQDRHGGWEGAMENHFKIECPKCKVVVIVDRITGEVLETREPLVAESTGDRFGDALKKVKIDRQEAEEKFRQAREAEKNRKQDLDQLFRKSMEQAKKEGPPEKPIRNIDLD